MEVRTSLLCYTWLEVTAAPHPVWVLCAVAPDRGRLQAQSNNQRGFLLPPAILAYRSYPTLGFPQKAVVVLCILFTFLWVAQSTTLLFLWDTKRLLKMKMLYNSINVKATLLYREMLVLFSQWNRGTVTCETWLQLRALARESASTETSLLRGTDTFHHWRWSHSPLTLGCKMRWHCFFF